MRGNVMQIKKKQRISDLQIKLHVTSPLPVQIISHEKKKLLTSFSDWYTSENLSFHKQNMDTPFFEFTKISFEITPRPFLREEI